MRTWIALGIISIFAAQTVRAADVPITSNPIPQPIVKRGIAVEVKDLARLPDTRGLRPANQDVASGAWARVSYVRDLPDGRRFANDSRGLLYLFDSNNQPQVYADVGAAYCSSRYLCCSSSSHDFRYRFITASKAASSVLSFTPNLRRTAYSTRCTTRGGLEIQRRPTLFRSGTD
jgi:hypothetical protein